MMSRCLNERALLGIYTHDATPVERAHLALCAACTERYEQLVADLAMIGLALEAPPPVRKIRHVSAWHAAWVPVALAAAAMVVVALDVGGVWRSGPQQVALNPGKIAAFTADLSNALFTTGGPNAAPQMVAEAAYLDAALDAGHPCTPERFVTGGCDDGLSAVMIESD